MSDQINVTITNSDVLPAGIVLQVPRHLIQELSDRAYFGKRTDIGSVRIPADTVLIFNTPVVADTPTVQARAVTGTWTLTVSIDKGGLKSTRKTTSLRGHETQQDTEAALKAYLKQVLDQGYQYFYAEALKVGQKEGKAVKLKKPESLD